MSYWVKGSNKLVCKKAEATQLRWFFGLFNTCVGDDSN